ncbi:protein YaiW [Enterobacter cancerogenus]|uniref:Protein YaiW n=1 Tax=Enterobacter cancerogenus TaxID=69218 RepID=A0A484XLQ9_9ENTR|nr:protein YaiW [Enterobacter cancerogenus]
MPFAVPRALPLSLLAAFVLAGCAEKGAEPLKKGEKPVDVASVVRQKMPASVKDRNQWADALAKTFESQKIALPRRTSARCWRLRSRSRCTSQTRQCPG